MSTMQTELIIVSEYCQKCHIEPSFIEMLEEGGIAARSKRYYDNNRLLIEKMAEMGMKAMLI